MGSIREIASHNVEKSQSRIAPGKPISQKLLDWSWESPIAAQSELSEVDTRDTCQDSLYPNEGSMVSLIPNHLVLVIDLQFRDRMNALRIRRPKASSRAWSFI